MPVNVVVKFDFVGAEKIDKHEQGLDNLAQAAKQTTTALGQMGTAGKEAATATRATAEELDREAQVLNLLKRPLSEYKADWDAIVKLGHGGSVDELTAALQREAKILDQINGPMREYQAQVKALDALVGKGEIDLADYNRELEKASKAAGKGLNPVQGPKPPGMAGPVGGGGAGGGDLLQAVAPQLGQGGQILGQFASGGVAAAAAGAAALVAELVHLSDEYTALTSSVERFTTDTVSANDIIHQQLDLSRELHSSLDGAAALYTRVRESTYELNLSSRQQIGLAHDLGVEIAAEGKSAEDAASLMRRLSLAFETGAIAGRELRGIMKQYPELASELAGALGHSTSEMIQMANKGQISAQQLIDAFHRIAPEAEQTLGRMHETFGQSIGHTWDDLRVGIGGAIDALWGVVNPVKADIDALESMDRHLHSVRESARQLNADLEKNAKTAQITSAAQKLGITLPGFDQAAADSITRMRMTAREAGIDIADAFGDAKAKAQLYGTEIEKIRDARAAKIIAEDAHRIYESLDGANNLLEDQARHWQAIRDEVTKTAGAIGLMQAHRLFSGAPLSPDERDAMLKEQNDKASLPENIGQYGKGMVSYAQGVNTARAELEALNRAAHDGVISGEALRQKTDAILTTLNDGRLPEAIKIMEGIHLPIDQATRDFAALSALFRQERVDVEQYTKELQKIAGTKLNGEATLLANTIAVLDKRAAEGQLAWSLHNDAVRKVIDSYNELHRTASGITYRMAPNVHESQPDVPTMPAQNIVDRNTDIQRAMANPYLHPTSLGPIAGPWDTEASQLNKRIEDAMKLAASFEAPAAKYEQELKKIADAVEFGGMADDEATASRQRAKIALNQETEALAAMKGPQETYNATLKKLDDQLHDSLISQSKYTDAVRKAREQLITDTGGDKTFLGALELQWTKLQQQADRLGATIADQLLGDVDKFNDALVSAANNGQVSFTAMADAMIQDLERVALKMLEMKAIGALFSAFSGGGGGSEFETGATGGAFANGGSFLVGGSGPPDSKLFNLRLSPGEAVSVRTPGQQSDARARLPAPQAAPVVNIHNHYDSSVAQATIDGPGGQKSVINTLRLNPGAARNMTSRPRRA